MHYYRFKTLSQLPVL